MLKHIKEFVKNKYNLDSNLEIDLTIKSLNGDETIRVEDNDDKIFISYKEKKYVTDEINIYKDLSYILDRLINIYYLDISENILYTSYFIDEEESVLNSIEDNLWKNRKEYNVESVYVSMFAFEYFFISKVSGSFVDTFFPIYDKAHFQVSEAARKTFKYREPYYARKSQIIKNDINLAEIKKYILRFGYGFLVSCEDIDYNIYQIINIDFESFEEIMPKNYLIMSADYKSIIYVCDNKLYLKGEIDDVYKTIYKSISVDNKIADYIHNIHTSRLRIDGKIYEAYGKSISEELNNLERMLDGKIISCFFCKYGNYLYNEEDIYCLKGFKYKNLTDIAFNIKEALLIPYDMFNLCADFRYQEENFYTHTKCDYKIK